MPTSKSILWLCLFPTALIASPIFTDTGSASLTCISLAGGAPVTTAFTASEVSATCPDGDIDETLSGGANTLAVAGSIYGNGFGASYHFMSQMEDTVTESNGTGTGIEQFIVTFDWLGIDDPGGSDVQAQFFYNGIMVWSEDHPTRGHLNTFPQESAATFEEPFTYGQPFTFEAQISTEGECSTGLYWCFATSHGTLAVEHSDPTPVPESSSLVFFMIGLIGIVLLVSGLRWFAKAVKNDPPVTDGDGKFIG
jgi:hypothetical protein